MFRDFADDRRPSWPEHAYKLATCSTLLAVYRVRINHLPVDHWIYHASNHLPPFPRRIRSLLSLLRLFHFLYGNRFLSRGFTDWREILHGCSATSRAGHLPFCGDSPRDGRILGVSRGGAYGGICFLLKHLFIAVLAKAHLGA